MHDIEDVIEKYRRELMEFSRQNSVHSYDADSDEDEAQSVQVMAQPVEEMQPERIEIAPLPRSYQSYDEFLNRNPSRGSLRVQAFASQQSFPIPNAKVTVSVTMPHGEHTIYEGYTDVDGIVDGISLPAPSSSYSMQEENDGVEPYAVYNVTVSHPNFAGGEYRNIPIFDSITSIQPAELVPLTDSGESPQTTVVDNEPMSLFGGEADA